MAVQVRHRQAGAAVSAGGWLPSLTIQPSARGAEGCQHPHIWVGWVCEEKVTLGPLESETDRVLWGLFPVLPQ